jgi:hypothetical protein
MTPESILHRELMQQVINRTSGKKHILDSHWLYDIARDNIRIIVQDMYKAYLMNPARYVSMIDYLEAWLERVSQNPQFHGEDVVRLENMLYKLKYLIPTPTLLHHELSYIPQTEHMVCLWHCRTMNVQSHHDIYTVFGLMMSQS